MRKTAKITIEEPGRDKGKVFLITEMFADQGEEWALRALIGLMQSGVDVPEGFPNLGMAALAEMGLKSLSGMRWDLLKPLLDEMFECVQFIGDPAKVSATTRPLIREDIEEIPTRFKLRVEWGKLHLDFLSAAVPSLLEQAKTAAGKRTPTRTQPK